MADSTAATTTDTSLVSRMIRAARLDTSLYEEVEHDQTATRDAGIVVAIVAVCSAISQALTLMTHPAVARAVAPPNPIVAAIGALIAALLGWVVWSYVTYFVGTRLFHGTATPGEMLRTIGFAQSPGVLSILGFIPVLGGIVGLVVFIWTLVAGVIAVRQALDFDTGKAILTAIVGWLFLVIITIAIAVIVGGAAYGLGATSGAGTGY
jgi:hypothetical protein